MARLLEGVCQNELACATGLDEALTAYEANAAETSSSATASSALADAGTASELVEPFADLAYAAAALASGDANVALGHALAASLARPKLAPSALRIAAKAEESLELLASEEVDDDEDGEGEDGEWGAKRRRQGEDELLDVQRQHYEEEEEEEAGLPSLAALHKLVGLGDVKEHCANLVEALNIEKERGDDPKQQSFSLVLTGNPGTGKSTFAKLYGELLGDLRLVPKGRVVRITGSQLGDGGVKALEDILEVFDEPGEIPLEVGDLVEAKRNGKWGHFGRIVHHDTSEVGDARPQFRDTYDVHFGKMVEFTLSNGSVVTRRDHDFDIGVRRKDLRVSDETGGVLIVDDAHQLEPANEKGARQVLYRLADEMDKRGGKLAVVLAGYEKPIDERLLGFNYGALSARFRRRYDLPDFGDAELIELMQSMLQEAKPKYHVADDKYVRIAARRVGKGRGAVGFGNAFAVKAVLERAYERQTARVVAERKEGLEPDIFAFERADLLGEPPSLLDEESCDALRELRELEGLHNVKASVDGLLRLAESNAAREELEMPTAEVSLNRIFLGNPGTGKTTVARLYGQILKSLGLLSVGEVVLATPSDLIGSALGQSEEKTNALLDKSQGCVLVIDEAYGLDPTNSGSFASVGGPAGGGGGGDPFKTAVIDTLVSRVQGDAGADRCVLLLGYRKEMERFIRRGNPGLARRFQLEKAFVFDDYDDQALLRILLRNVARRGKSVSFDTAKRVVRDDLAKARMRPNFGNAGAVDNCVSSAVVRAEARLETLPAAERAAQSQLVLTDFVVEKPHVADPSLVFEGLIGCENIKTRLQEYQAVIKAAARAGRDPMDDLALTFCFQGSPGTGKTTVARRMGMLFEALGVLPSADVVQVSASQFSTGFVGQTAANTRDIFDSARGAVLFVDEAYRLYDPLGRSFMQEAIDEIVTLLTEDEYRGKMVVIFAGYAGQMTELLDKVNPGLKSRVSDVIDFPDFDAEAAAELAAMQLADKRLQLPEEGEGEQQPGSAFLEPWTRQLEAAPFWANGRDVETFVRRVAVECATRETVDVTAEALDAALASVLKMKGGQATSTPTPTAAQPPTTPRRGGGVEEKDDTPPIQFADPAWQAPPAFDIQAAIKTAKMEDGGGDDEDEDEDEEEIDFAEALEEAVVDLGYDKDDQSRGRLEKRLSAAADGSKPFPKDIRNRVARSTGAKPEMVDMALKRRVKPMLVAVRSAISYKEERREQLDELDDDEREKELDEEAFIMDRLRTMGPCPQGFSWFRSGNGWRCGGGSHFVYDDDPILKRDA